MILFQNKNQLFLFNNQSLNIKENQLSMEESQLSLKEKTWKDKLNYSKLNIQISRLSQTLDLVSTGKEKVLTRLLIPQSKEISKRLWLPTKIDCVDSVLSSSRESSTNSPMGKSWFSIQKKHPLKKSSLMTSFQSSQFSLPESMDSDLTQLKRKSKKQPVIKQKIKTLKIRLFPNPNEKEKLKDMFSQHKWYYNATLSIVHQHYGDKLKEPLEYSNITIRNLIRKYDYIEEEKEETKIKYFVYDEKRNEMPNLDWWNYKHSRVPRGAIEKFVMTLFNYNMSIMFKSFNVFIPIFPILICFELAITIIFVGISIYTIKSINLFFFWFVSSY